MKKLILTLIPMLVALSMAKAASDIPEKVSDSNPVPEPSAQEASSNIGARLLGNSTPGDSPAQDGFDALGEFLSRKLHPRELISARLVSMGEDGKIIRGPGALPVVKRSSAGNALEIAFRVELEYDRKAYYSKILPELLALLDSTALSKVEKATSVRVEKASREPARFMAVTRSASFPIPIRLNLTRQSDRLVFSDWHRKAKINQSSLYLACNLGRDARGKHQRFAVYEMDRASFASILKDAPGRVIPPLNLILEDANGSVIRQDRWFPRLVKASKSADGIEEAGVLTRLSASHGQSHYDLHSATYSDPLSEGIIRMDEGSGRDSCFTLAPWFTYSASRSSRSFYSDSPVLERILEMDPKDLRRVSKIRLFF
jgi:hypothetical protein